MSKIQIICDKNGRSLNIKKSLIKILKRNEIKKPNLAIVIGGDGFMLQTLKTVISKGDIESIFAFNKFLIKFLVENLFIKKP